MDWHIHSEVPFNSADYFEKTLITENGFREYDVRWRLADEINPNGFVVLGRAFGTYVRRVLHQRKVVVGHDFRKYSQDLSRSLVLGLLWSGVDVVDIGLALSPILYFAQHHLGVKGGDFEKGQGTYESCPSVFDAYLKDVVGDHKLTHPVDMVLAAGNGTAGRFA